MSTSGDNSRIFEPGPLKSGPGSILKYYPASGLTFTRAEVKGTLSTTILVGVGGACRSNGSSPEKASWGIHFGRNSPYNTCGLVPEAERKTNNVAEIYAALNTVKLVSERVLQGPREIKELVILSDSALLVKSMTESIDTWKQKGWKNAKKKPVVNLDLIQELDELIDDVEMTFGLTVKFWHVRRKHNARADRLANIPLDHDVDWKNFWQNQLSGEPKVPTADLLSIRPLALEIMAPIVLCLEYPLTGKGGWNSFLRAFHIIHTIRKVKSMYTNLEAMIKVQGELFSAILGPNSQHRANTELQKHEEKFETQNALLQAAVKRFKESEDDSKKKLAVIAILNNHIMMTIISRSLKVALPSANENEMCLGIIERYLSHDRKWDASKKYRALISHVTVAGTGPSMQYTSSESPPQPSDPPSKSTSDPQATPSRSSSKASTLPRPRSVDRIQRSPSPDPGGVRLDWSEEEWVNLECPSS